MPQAEAFCEEHGRNITLDEAHDLYFAQPVEERKRFNFRCGDPRCLAMLQPKVVAALYNRAKTPDDASDVKLRSPYFRENPKYLHILSCTWKNDEKSEQRLPATSSLPKPATPIEEDQGLVFKLRTRSAGGDKKAGELEPDDDGDDDGDDAEDIDVKSKVSARPKARAQTSKFMATVAMKYLQYTEHERKTVNLTLEGICKAPFYNVCVPIVGFHPYYQHERIYHGLVEVHELTNVFYIRFKGGMSPSGDKSARTTVAQIKLAKSWLDKNYRALRSVLSELSSKKYEAWCFFYTTLPVEMKRERAEFTVRDASHIAVIDKAEIHLREPIET